MLKNSIRRNIRKGGIAGVIASIAATVSTIICTKYDLGEEVQMSIAAALTAVGVTVLDFAKRSLIKPARKTE